MIPSPRGLSPQREYSPQKGKGRLLNEGQNCLRGSLVRFMLYPCRTAKCQQTSTNRSAGSLTATASSATSAVSIAADIVFLDSRKAVAALSFSTTGGRIAASMGTAGKVSCHHQRVGTTAKGHACYTPQAHEIVVFCDA